MSTLNFTSEDQYRNFMRVAFINALFFIDTPIVISGGRLWLQFRIEPTLITNGVDVIRESDVLAMSQYSTLQITHWIIQKGYPKFMQMILKQFNNTAYEILSAHNYPITEDFAAVARKQELLIRLFVNPQLLLARGDLFTQFLNTLTDLLMKEEKDEVICGVFTMELFDHHRHDTHSLADCAPLNLLIPQSVRGKGDGLHLFTLPKNKEGL